MRNALLLALVVSTHPGIARGQFARPPTDVLAGDSESPRHGTERSDVRAHLGPAIDISNGDAGLQAALDFGDSAGGRLSASFVAVGADGGAATYGGELWLCPWEFERVRPIVAAGVGLRNVSRAREGATSVERFGVATLRGGFEVLLPTRQVDTRVGVSLTGHLPAIVPSANPDPGVSALLAGTLAVGF